MKGDGVFAHEKLREGLLADLETNDHQALHRQVGQVIEQTYPDDPEQAAVLLYHWHEAGELEKERQSAKMAGEYALSQYAHQEAVTFLSRALELTPEVDYAERYAILLLREQVFDLQANREANEADLITLAQLAELLEDERRQAEVALRTSQYAESISDYSAAITAAQQAVKLAKKTSDQYKEANGYSLWGAALRRQGEYEQALERFESGLSLARKLGERSLEASILQVLGLAYRSLNDEEATVESLTKSLHIYRELGDRVGEGRSLNNLIPSFEDLQVRLESFDNALEAIHETGDRRFEAIVINNLGDTLRVFGDYEKAREYFFQALPLLRETGDREHEGLTLYNLGLISQNLDENETAVTYCQQAIDLTREIDARHWLAHALTAMGHALVALNRLTEAEDYYRQAIALRQEMGEPHLITESYAGLAQVKLDQGQPAQALEPVEIILDFLKDNSIFGTEEPGRIYLTCYRILTANGDRRAQSTLKTAYDWVQSRAKLAGDEAMHRRVLENIAPHREIVKAYEESEKAESLAIEMMVNGRYQLHEKLGEGGMGIVFRATDRLTGGVVALKQVHLSPTGLHVSSRSKTMTSKDIRLALASEFQTLASLHHPHIINVLDYGFDDLQKPFFTMAYLENAQTILEASIGKSVNEQVQLLSQLLLSLAYLHQRDILHRDLKPENVLVTNGIVQVLDFGLAAPTNKEQSSGGSYAYMAPEIWRDEPITVSSDLYAVGVLAYEIFAGRHPHDITSLQFIDNVLDIDPDLTLLQVDEPLAAVIGNLLAKSPEGRYGNAKASRTALLQAIGEPSPDEDVSIRESFLQAATFVGREKEMAKLSVALNQVMSGEGSAWLVGGESGVGKSRFLDEFRIKALVEGHLFYVVRV